MPTVEVAARVSQEFYCGECKHYFFIRMNAAVNDVVWIVCPNKSCKHEHRRCVVDGHIVEDGRWTHNPTQKIISMPTSLSLTPRTQKMEAMHQKNSYQGRRDSVPIADQQRTTLFADLWLDKSIREKEGE